MVGFHFLLQLVKEREKLEKGLSGIISQRLQQEQQELIKEGSEELLEWFCTFDNDEGEAFPDLNDEVIAEYEDTTTSPVDMSRNPCVGVAREEDEAIPPSLHRESDPGKAYAVAYEALKSLSEKNENLLGYKIAESAYDPGSEDFMDDCNNVLFAVHPVFGAFYKIKVALKRDSNDKAGAAKVIGESPDEEGDIVTRSLCYHRKWVAKPIVKPLTRNSQISHLVNPEQLPKAQTRSRALEGTENQEKENSKLTVNFILPFRASNLNTLPQLIRSLEVADKVRRSDEQATKKQPLVRLIVVKMEGEENADQVKNIIDLKNRIGAIVQTALKSVNYEIVVADPLPATQSSAQHIKDLTKDWIKTHYESIKPQSIAKKSEEELRDEKIAGKKGEEQSVAKPQKKSKKSKRHLENNKLTDNKEDTTSQENPASPPGGSNVNANLPTGQKDPSSQPNSPNLNTNPPTDPNKVTDQSRTTNPTTNSAASAVLPSRWLSAVMGGLANVPYGRSIVFILDSSTATVSASLAKKTLWRVIEGRQVFAPIPYAVTNAYTDDDMSEVYRDDGGASYSDADVPDPSKAQSGELLPFQTPEFYTANADDASFHRNLRSQVGDGRRLLGLDDHFLDDVKLDDDIENFAEAKFDDDYKDLLEKDDDVRDFTGLEDDAIAEAEKEIKDKEWMTPFQESGRDDIVDDYPAGGPIIENASEDDDEEALVVDEAQWQRLTLLGATKVDISAAIFRILLPSEGDKESSTTNKRNLEFNSNQLGDSCVLRRLVSVLMSNDYRVARAAVAGLRVKNPYGFDGDHQAPELGPCECDSKSSEPHCVFRLSVSTMDDENDKMRVQCAVSQIHAAIENSKEGKNKVGEVGFDEYGDFNFKELVGVHHPVRYFDPSQGTDIVAKVTSKDYVAGHDAPAKVPLTAEVFSFKWSLSNKAFEYNEIDEDDDDKGFW